MMKARQQQIEKKIMTERGMPSQIIASLGKPEASMAFGSNSNKFKSGFGKDGSQIHVAKRKYNFADSQRLDSSQLRNGASDVVSRLYPSRPTYSNYRTQQYDNLQDEEHIQQEE